MPDPGAPPQPEGSGLDKKLGPLPRWAWIGLATAAAVVGLVWWRSRKSADDGSQTPVNVGGNEAAGLAEEQFQSLYAILRDLQGSRSTPPGGDTTDNTPVYVDVQEGTWAEKWLKDHPEYGLDLNKLKTLNPGVILNAGPGGYGTGNVPVINSAGSGGKVRVK